MDKAKPVKPKLNRCRFLEPKVCTLWVLVREVLVGRRFVQARWRYWKSKMLEGWGMVEGRQRICRRQGGSEDMSISEKIEEQKGRKGRNEKKK